MTNTNTSKFSSTEPALYFLEDIMERAMIPFFLLGKTAQTVRENLDVDPIDPIEAGIKRTDYTEYAHSTLKMFLPTDTVFTKKAIKLEWQGTPITIKIIDKKWAFIQNLDSVFYKLTSFRTPNPFSAYWKIRGLVK